MACHRTQPPTAPVREVRALLAFTTVATRPSLSSVHRRNFAVDDGAEMYPDGGTSPADATSLRAMKYVRRFRFCITCVLANNSTAIDSEVLKPIAIHFCHTGLNIERAPLEGVDHELDAKNEIHRRASQSVVGRFNQEDARQSKRQPRATLERRLPRPLGEAEVTYFAHFCLILAVARHVERRNSAPGIVQTVALSMAQRGQGASFGHDAYVARRSEVEVD